MLSPNQNFDLLIPRTDGDLFGRIALVGDCHLKERAIPPHCRLRNVTFVQPATPRATYIGNLVSVAEMGWRFVVWYSDGTVQFMAVPAD